MVIRDTDKESGELSEGELAQPSRGEQPGEGH
jgi:hypothetical protein